MSAQTDDIDARITDGFATCNDIGRDIHREAAAALYHHVATHTAELMTEHFSGNDGIVVDFDLTTELGGVAYDTL